MWYCAIFFLEIQTYLDDKKTFLEPVPLHGNFRDILSFHVQLRITSTSKTFAHHKFVTHRNFTAFFIQQDPHIPFFSLSVMSTQTNMSRREARKHIKEVKTDVSGSGVVLLKPVMPQ